MTADVAETALEGSPAGVEIAVWDDDTALREDASSLGDGQYEAAFSSADLETGTYSVTAVAQGTETIGSMSEVLGVSASHGLTVSDSNDEDSGEDVPPSEPDDSEETNGSDDDDSETDNGADEIDGDDENDSAEQNDDDGSEETDDGGVQQPNLEDDSDDSAGDGAENDDSDAVPLVGPVAIAVAALVAGLLVRVCRQ